MKQTKTYAFYLGFVCLLLSCAPLPVVRMTPFGQQTKFDWGSEVVTLNNEKVQVEIAYIRSTDAYLFFDFTVSNASGDTILVSPERFYFTQLNADTSEVLSAKVYAVNPEKELLEIDKREARENAESREAFLVEMTAATVNTISDVSGGNRNKTKEELNTDEAQRQNRREDYELEEQEREFIFQSLNEQRAYWANQMFRKTHIPYGYEMRGRVAFPRSDKSPLLKFNFKIEGKDFEVNYKQKLIRSQY